MTELPSRIEDVLDEFEGMLASLQDDLNTAKRDPSWDYEGTGREVLQASSQVAQALVDALRSMDIPYADLDEVLRAIASRDPSARECADLGGQVFEFLRKISYAGGPDPHDAPDMSDFGHLLRELPSSPWSANRR